MTDQLVDAIASAVMDRLKPALQQAQGVRPRLLTVEQAATYLGRTPNAIRMLQKAGTVPCVRTDNRVMFDVHDLDRWIEQNKQ